MRLYLARHGDYELDRTKALDVLSEKGITDITQLANSLKQRNLHVRRIWHSEKNRARQTAEILAQGVICDELPVVHAGINPEDDVTIIASEIVHEPDDILIVGHLPFMNKLVSQLVTGNINAEIIHFETGTLVCLEQKGKMQWMIDWVMTP